MDLLDKAVFASTNLLGMKARMRVVKKYNLWKRGEFLQQRRRFFQEWRARHEGARAVPLADAYAIDQTHSLPHLHSMIADAKEIIGQNRKPPSKGKDYLINHLHADDFERYPSFLDFATSDEMIATAGEYLGLMPVLSVVELWKSEADQAPDLGSMLFHLDNADDRQVKVFVCLHDIDAETGPFAFMPASVSAKVCGEVGYGKVAGVERLTDAQVYSIVPKGELRVCAYPEGTVVFVDTIRCLHYGSRGNSKPRYMLMCQYLTPCRADFRSPSLRRQIRATDSEARKLLLDSDR